MAEHTPKQHVERIREALQDCHTTHDAAVAALAAAATAQEAHGRQLEFLHRRLQRAANEYPDLLGMTPGEVGTLSAGGTKNGGK